MNTAPDTALYQAIDGRIWYFPEISNYWSTKGSKAANDWYALDFGQPEKISVVKIYLFSDGQYYDLPDEITIDYQNGKDWVPAKIHSVNLLANSGSTVSLDQITASRLRIHFRHDTKQVALCEIECYQ